MVGAILVCVQGDSWQSCIPGWCQVVACPHRHKGIVDAVERMMLDPLTILLALPVFLFVVLVLGGAALTWGLMRTRMWQRAYPWWNLKPKALLRYVLLHIL
ncbi:MAG TPA: hypothetical protein VGP82_05120 [Ktedonobacterales bacterium]|nr:hypothetical protein [Ktedonobacterales bacterium]